MLRFPFRSFFTASLLLSVSVALAAEVKVEVLQSKLDHPSVSYTHLTLPTKA